MNIVALVPMRHRSERVPGKNYRSLGGRPLYQHIIRTLVECPKITEIVIDTDSPTIEQDVTEHAWPVRIIQRPEHLRDGDIPMNEVLLHDVRQVAADFYLQTHSTNPLLRAETINAAIDRLLQNYPSYDSLFSVTPMQTRLWNQLGQPVNHNPQVLLRTQDLPPVYEENSNLYIFTRETLENRRNRLGERPLMFEIDRLESWDIDEELDFAVAEFLYLKTREPSETSHALESPGLCAVHAARS
jgi:CMP-N-acetylneuraminic acid synthetase